MQYVQKYMELYPEDATTITGGAAAYLQLLECSINIPVKDIDVNISTIADGKTVLDRWLSIVPPSYTAQYDVDYLISIFTLVDTTGRDLSLDIFVNEEYIQYTEQIGSFRVERLDKMINRIYQELKGRKIDIDFIRSGVIEWNQQELPSLIDKYNRMLDRLQQLIKCFKQRQATIPNLN